MVPARRRRIPGALPQVDDEAAACAVAERLLAAGGAGHHRGPRHPGARQPVAPTWSIGRSAAQLLRACDQAMYAAKRVDGSAVVTSSAMSTTPRCGRARLTADLREALAQASSRCTTRRWSTCGARRCRRGALRWQHPRVRHRLAGRVRAAARAQRADRAGRPGALRRACEQLLEWQAAGSTISCGGQRLGGAAGALELLRGRAGGHRRHRHRAAAHHHRGHRVGADGQPERCIEQLQRLRQAGLRIAIDDFGAGYPRPATCAACRCR